MGQYADSIGLFLRYGLKVLPDLHKKATRLADVQNRCISQTQGLTAANTDAVTEHTGITMLCSSFFALYPGADINTTISFIHSLYSLSDMLEAYRSKTGITDEAEIHKLYSCLTSAVDPSRGTGCYWGNILKAEAGQIQETPALACLSDQCRLQLAVLPSFSLVAPKLKKYMQLYSNLQSYRHYPAIIREEHLKAWSDYYVKRYQDISCWEFCAASDSLIGVIAMYISAANPKLTADDVALLDEACFPWLCGFDSLLHAMICERSSIHTEHLCFTSFYTNLKTCEDRLLFFEEKAVEACMKLKESSFYLSLIKTMTGMYLTDPEASFGMYKLASMNILKKSSPQFQFYSNVCKLLRFYHTSVICQR